MNAITGNKAGSQETVSTPGKATAVAISAPNIIRAEFGIIGTAPLMLHAFSAKAQQTIRETQEAGATAKTKKKRDAKDFDAVFQGARHLSTEGWDGIPAAAFRAGMISACRLVGYKMTIAKMSVFVLADGLDAVSGQGLVRIDAPPPEKNEMMARNANFSTDIRVRPMWRQWACTVRVEFDGDQFTLQDVSNLLSRVGVQVGVGEGRPDSRNSAGLGFGTFRLASE